jgi:hypothetical protein
LIEDHRIPTRKIKKVKDPAAPKRARGSFVFFTFDMRPQILKEFPGIKFVELGTIMGERWRALSPEEKKKYEDMAAEDKQRFNEEMQKYMANKAVAAIAQPAQQQPQAASASVQYQYPDMYAVDPQMAAHYSDYTQGYDQHYQYH